MKKSLFICLLTLSLSLLTLSQQTASRVEPPRTADLSFRYEIKQPAFPRGKGPVVVIDEAHRNFHTAGGTYLPFARLLEQDGYIIQRGRQPISFASLRKTQILVIADAQPPFQEGEPPTFSDEEITILNQWVREGGCLFLITDHYPDPAAIEKLALSFGVKLHNGYVLNGFLAGRERPIIFRRAKGTLKDHAVTNGRHSGEKVKTVATFTGSAFQPGPHFKPILVFGPGRKSWQPKEFWKFPPDTPTVNVTGWCQGAVAKFGQGKIAFFAEAAMFTAQIFDQGRVKAGFNHPLGKGNAQLLLNIMHWFSGLLPSQAENN